MLIRRPPRIAIVAGEASGDWLGAELMYAIRALAPAAEFCGMAGPAMLAAGCEPYAHIDQLSVMGLTEVLRSYPRLRRLRAELVSRLLTVRPDVFVGIDAPDFNLGIARRLKQNGVVTVHYVCPQAWAWRPRRARDLAMAVDELLALLPFEPAFFAQYGVPCTFVGHPLADALPLTPARSAAKAALGFAADTTLVALLPGSRRQELERLLPIFLAGARLLASARPAVRFVACVARPAQLAFARSQLDTRATAALDVTLVHGRAREVLTAADVALVASGTVTLEGLLCRTPMVVGYRLATATYHIIRRMVTIPRIALPNILAGEELVPELIQNALTPAAIRDALGAWLDQPARCQRYAERAAVLHQSLRGACAARAAQAVLNRCQS